jgi:hypothetical protein
MTSDEPALSEDVLAVAQRIREAMDGWVGRMAGAAGAGRGATSVARMATARAIAELRNVSLPSDSEPGSLPVADYLRRSRSVLTNAAHEIERNRYSFQAMDSQLQRMEDLVKRIFPEDEPEADAAEPVSEDSADSTGGADDGGAGREVSPG